MGFFDFLKPKQKTNPALDAMMQKVALVAFPGGPAQIREESLQLHALLGGRLSHDEAGHLLRKTKALLVISEDKSDDRIVRSILLTTNGKLTSHEAKLVYVFLTGISGPRHSGGDGSSPEKAVIINATSTVAGIAAEYSWIEERYGKRDVAWTVRMRSHGTRPDGKSIETFVIALANGAELGIHFDISAFYGRF